MMPESLPQDNSVKALRDLCRSLKLTAQTAGCSIDELIRRAKASDDPRAWLAAIADAPPDEFVGDEPSTAEVDENAAELRALAHQTIAPSNARFFNVTITLPISVKLPKESNVTHGPHLEVHLKHSTAVAFKRLEMALNENNFRLGNGKHVGETHASSLTFILEALAAAVADAELTP